VVFVAAAIDNKRTAAEQLVPLSPEGQLAQPGLRNSYFLTAPHPQYPTGSKNTKKLNSLLDFFVRFRLRTLNNTMLPIYKTNIPQKSVCKKEKLTVKVSLK